MSGGWKIAKTMGSRITKSDSIRRCKVAETAGCNYYSLPVTLSISGLSTTHHYRFYYWCRTYQRVSAMVRWGVTISLLWAWIITIPISAVIAIMLSWCNRF